MWRLPLAIAVLLFPLAACGEQATLPLSAGFGPNPTLPPPVETAVPTVVIAPAKGWQPGTAPIPAEGLKVTAFATGLAHPRWLAVLPDGDVLVAETNAPPKPDDNKGITGWAATHLMRRAGAVTESANRITLLRDSTGSGHADTRSAFLQNLNSPFGMAVIGDHLFVADTDALLRFPYQPGETRIAAPGVKLVDLPAGPINHHWTKNVIASPDGTRLYVTTGSNSDHGENGMAVEEGRAAIWLVDPLSGAHRIFASGLRNPDGMGFEPVTGALWSSVNERDELGSDLVPDYITSVKDGAFYGWPYSYYGQHEDTRVAPQRPDLVAKAIAPDYAVGAHTASLGMTFSTGAKLPPPFVNGVFVSQHGSWNRNPPSGYRVIFIPFANGKPSGPPIDVLTGFLDAQGNAQGRPVGVAIDARGGLLVADDVGNTIWRVSAAQR